MIDCELRGLNCEPQVQTPRNPRECDVRRDGGVVTQRTANPPTASLLANKFARFTVRSTHGIPWVLSAAANSTLASAYEKGPLGCSRTTPTKRVGGSNG